MSKHASSDRGSTGSTPDPLLALDATVYDRQMILHLLLSGAGRQLRSKEHSWQTVQHGLGCTRPSEGLLIGAAKRAVLEEMDISNAISEQAAYSSGYWRFTTRGG